MSNYQRSPCCGFRPPRLSSSVVMEEELSEMGGSKPRLKRTMANGSPCEIACTSGRAASDHDNDDEGEEVRRHIAARQMEDETWMLSWSVGLQEDCDFLALCWTGKFLKSKRVISQDNCTSTFMGWLGVHVSNASLEAGKSRGRI